MSRSLGLSPSPVKSPLTPNAGGVKSPKSKLGIIGPHPNPPPLSHLVSQLPIADPSTSTPPLNSSIPTHPLPPPPSSFLAQVRCPLARWTLLSAPPGPLSLGENLMWTLNGRRRSLEFVEVVELNSLHCLWREAIPIRFKEPRFFENSWQLSGITVTFFWW